MDPAFLIAYVSAASACLPLIAMRNRWKSSGREIRHVAMIAAGALLFDLTGLFLAINGINSLLLGNGYLFLQTGLLIRIFSFQYRNVKVLIAVFAVLTIIYVVNTIFFRGPWQVNAEFLAASSIVMIVLSLQYFYRLLTKLPTTYIHRLPMLWISFAVLFYYSGNFFQFLTTNYILEGDMGAARMLWILHNLLNILKNILFTIAIWQSYRRTSSSLS